MEKLAKRINNSTTVTAADCYAVLKSMKDNIVEALSEGQVVVLEDLGRFQVSLQGKSYSAETMQSEEFSPSAMIKGHKIVFRPDPRLKEEVRNGFKLKRISSDAMEKWFISKQGLHRLHGLGNMKSKICESEYSVVRK